MTRRGSVATAITMCVVLLGAGCTVAGSETRPKAEPTWNQEFDGPAGSSPDSDIWMVMDLAGGWGNNELQAYTPRPENVRLDGEGNLVITARQEQYVDPQGNTAEYTSARLETIEAFQYGTFEARMNVPAGQGLWSAFWLLGKGHWDVGWPKVGEIDIVEILGEVDHVNSTTHGFAEGSGHWQNGAAHSGDYGGSWHTYSATWTPEEIRFYVDGTEHHTVAKADLKPGEEWPFENPQHVIVNLAVGGDWPGAPDDTTSFPAELLIDYIRIHDSTIVQRD
ncbi:MAG: family 16 glycosylhydrolase [Cumulibacter sp.]